MSTGRGASVQRAMLVLLVALVGVGPAGCFSYVKRERVQQIEVKTEPPGALISEKTQEGTVLRGVAPVVIEKHYTASIRRFRRVHWIWPAVCAAALGGGIAWLSKEGANGTAVLLTSASALGLTISTILMIAFEVASGTAARADPEAVILAVQRPGGQMQEHRVLLDLEVPGRWSTTLRLSDDEPASRPTAAPSLPWHPRGISLAVFDVEDHTGSLPQGRVSELSERLAVALAARDFRVVPRDQLRTQLDAGAGRRRCDPGTCHRAVGRAVSARLTLWTRFQRIGEVCALRATLDNVSGFNERTAAVLTGCPGAKLLEAVDELAARIAGEPEAPPR